MSLMPWSGPGLPNDLDADRFGVTMAASAPCYAAHTLCSVHFNEKYVRLIGAAAHIQFLPGSPPSIVTLGILDCPGVPVADY